MERFVQRFVAVVLLGALWSGCLADEDSDAAADETAQRREAEIYDAIEHQIGEPFGADGRDPAAPESVNIERVATVTGEEGRTALPTEGYIETAVKGGYAYLARTGPQQGLVIFDVADIEHPRQVGYINLEAGFEADIEVSDDGNWAFWETQRFPTSAEVPNVLAPGANAQRGIHIVDISDKTNPRWAGFTPILPDGPHSITYANIGGRHIVFASTYAMAYAYGQVAPPGMQRLVILELDASGSIAQMRTLAEYMDPNAAEENIYPASGEKFPHDVAVQVHPLTGKTYAYVAYWDLGVVILDVTDPANPTKVGQGDDFGPAPYGDIHMARPFPGLIAGRHVTVTEPEISGAPDSGYLTFFDTTDPSNPTYISSWKMPGNSTSDASGGPHYFDAAFGRVAMAHYGAGFWVIDVHDEVNLLRPRTVAYSFVGEGAGSALPGPFGGLGGGSAFDAWWADATHVLGSETSNGLVVFRYTGPNPDVSENAS